MKTMYRLRQKRSSLSRPELRFVRTIQSTEHVTFDEKTKRYEISSAAFRASSSDKSLSGDLEELLDLDGLGVDALYPSISRAVGAVTFAVQEAVDLGLTVEHDPVPTNWYHGSVRGNLNERNRRALKRLSRELVPIDQESARRLEEQRKADTAVRESGRAS